jgi:hypothetical protein
VSWTEFVNHLIKSIRRVKETKRLMKEIWEQVGMVQKLSFVLAAFILSSSP